MSTVEPGSGRRDSRQGPVIVVVASLMIFSAATIFAVPAIAEPGAEVTQAVVDARGGTSCAPLRHNPTVEHAADIINRSTHSYLNHTAENVPADEPHQKAIVRDLGIEATRTASFQGAGHDVADATKGMLLEGRDAFPDCAYTDFGVSSLYEEQSDFTLVAVVLVAT